MSQKRSRSANWDEEEKQLLREILKNHSKIIENKCIKTNTNKAKSKAWDEVYKKFNELNCRPRDLNQLQVQWKTMKIQARKNISTAKRETFKTGGGPKPPSPSQEDVQIMDLLNPAEFVTDTNIYDSDGFMSIPIDISIEADEYANDNSVKEVNTVPITIDINMEADEDANDNSVKEDCNTRNSPKTPLTENKENSNFIPSTSVEIIKTPINKGSQTKTYLKKVLFADNNSNKKHKSKAKVDDYSFDILAHSKSLKNEEHKLRIKHMLEEHEMKMDIYKQELKIKQENAKAEREMAEVRMAREKISLQIEELKLKELLK